MSGHLTQATLRAHDGTSNTLKATVDRILWRADDGSAVICKSKDGLSIKCDGGAGEIEEGETYRFYGDYADNPRYGRQFLAGVFVPEVNGGRVGTIKYLCQLCPGIGQVRAEKIWEECQENSIPWLRKMPEDFIQEKLLPEEVAFTASRLLQEDEKFQQVRVDLFGLFAGRGFGMRTINACIAKWGPGAFAVVSKNPWQLLLRKMPGAGWKRVDKLYLENGGDPLALKRQALAGWYALHESRTGSTWLPMSAFDRGVIAHCGAANSNREGALNLAIRSGLVEIMTDWEPGKYVAAPEEASAERNLALAIGRLHRGDGASWPAICPPDVSPHQAVAIAAASVSHVMLLTGTPGTGKTYAAAQIIKAFAQSIGVHSVAVCAPTGKAANRIQENLRRNGLAIDATTIHRLLGISRNGRDGEGWDFQFCAENPLSCRLLVVDEFSMCDTSLAASLFSAFRSGTHVLIVGDPFQLPPVGNGCPLRDFLAAGLPNAHLTEIQRNSGTITAACAAIKDGKTPALPARLDVDAGHNCKIAVCADTEEQRKVIQDLLLALRAKPGVSVVWDCQILTPTNNSSRVSRKPLNEFLQPLLNPRQPSDPEAGQKTFAIRDKVICLSNTREVNFTLRQGKPAWEVESYSEKQGALENPAEVFVANGEIGAIVAVSGKSDWCVLRFDEPLRLVKIRAPRKSEQEDGTVEAREDGWALAYAVTIHKSQGSEWPYVIVVLDRAADHIASRELIYTAISRAKKWCILVGTEDVLRRQIRRAELPTRKTFLRELIECEVNRKG